MLPLSFQPHAPAQPGSTIPEQVRPTPEVSPWKYLAVSPSVARRGPWSATPPPVPPPVTRAGRPIGPAATPGPGLAPFEDPRTGRSRTGRPGRAVGDRPITPGRITAGPIAGESAPPAAGRGRRPCADVPVGGRPSGARRTDERDEGRGRLPSGPLAAARPRRRASALLRRRDRPALRQHGVGVPQAGCPSAQRSSASRNGLDSTPWGSSRWRIATASSQPGPPPARWPAGTARVRTSGSDHAAVWV